MQELSSSLDQLVAALNTFGIGSEELAPGEFEVGFLIPREAVDNELGELGEELVELKKEILDPVQELATGSRSDLKISVIASSDFQVFIEAIPDVAAMLSQVIVDLYSAYEKIKRIRARIAELLKDDGVPEEAVEGVKAYANQVMDLNVTAITERLIQEHAGNVERSGRTPDEMRVVIDRALRQTVRRIEERYTIDVRSYTKPPEPGEGEEQIALDPRAEEVRQLVEERQSQMRRLELTGEPILELEKGDTESSEKQEDEEAPSGE